MRSMRWVTVLGLAILLSTILTPPVLHAQVNPLPPFTLFVSQIDQSGSVRISWTPLPDVYFTKFYIYRATVPYVDSTSFGLIDSTQDMDYVDQLSNTSIATAKGFAYFVVGKTTGGTRIRTNIVVASVPGIPPAAAFRLDAKENNGVVHLIWAHPVVALSTPFSVYRINAMGATPVNPQPSGDTVVVGTTSDTTYIDTLKPGVAILNPEPRAYIYFIGAKTTGNVDIQSNLVSLVSFGFSNRDEVTITSTPGLTAQVGVQYSYDATAVSSNPAAVIHYYLVPLPLPSADVIQCDSVTGVITTTPSVKGIIPIHFFARSNMGGQANQDFQITVSTSNGIISGTVTDTLGQPIKGVLIQALKRDARSSFSYSALTDSMGKYRITHIDLGSYYLHAIPISGTFVDQWFDGKNSPALANPVIVADSPSVATADFKLRSKNAQLLPLFTVGGKVDDTLGLALPVAGTQVYFVDAEFAVNAPDVREYLELNRAVDFRLRGNSRFVFKTGIDSTGSYSMKIPEGAYIAFAVSPGYSPQFYSGKSYFLVADVIRLAADSMGINFDLSALPPVTLGEISGQVLDSVANIGVRARLIAFRPDWTLRVAPVAVRAFFTETDSIGDYTFADLLPGTYYILALPVGNYAPVFYSTNSQGLMWNKATPIVMDGNTLSGIDLFPRPLPDSCRGYTMISGSVTHSGNSNQAFAGAMVFASYQDGNIAGYTLSDAQGRFTIDGIGPGSYTVSADVPGFTLVNSAQSSPSYDASGNAVGATVSLSLQTTLVQTVTTSVIPTSYSIEQNYPNPFNPSTTIRYTLPVSGIVSVRVYNILGQLVTTLVDGNQKAGTYSVTFNASSLSSGVYFYRIQSGSFAAVKKMMLLK